MENLAIGFISGLSVGVYCLGLCLPAFLPVLLSQKRNLKKSFSAILEFSLGRLIGYFLFGLLFGYLGQTIKSQLIHTIFSLVNLWMGLSLIIFSLIKIDQKFCAFLPLRKIRWPILIGFLTGVNVCPPFIASLTHVFNLKSALKASFYFLSFFFGTSAYLIPAAFLGILTKFPFIQKLAKISGIVAGIYFVGKSLKYLR